MTEVTMSDPVTVEAMIAAIPDEEGRRLARLRVESWRLNYKDSRIMLAALRDLADAEEVCGGDPKILAAIRRARATALTFLECPCLCCGGEPPAGMTCQECNAVGPGRQRPAVPSGQLVLVPGTAS